MSYLNVVVYRAKVQGEYNYNYSLCPEIDYSYLRKFKGVNEIEVITPYIPLYMGKFILRMINRDIKKGFINFLKNRAAIKVLKSLNVEHIKLKISSGTNIPSEESINKVLEVIDSKVIALDILEEKTLKELGKKELYAILQVLHLQKKIKINPLYGKKAKKEYCDICDKVCEDCFLGYSENDILVYKSESLSLSKGSNIKYKESKIKKEFKSYVDSIGDFIDSKNENLVVVTAPMFKERVFSYKALYKVINMSGRVLYITAKEEMASLKKDIEEVLEGVSIYIFDGTRGFVNADIVICSYNNTPAFKDDFDLSILDDRISFIQRPYKNIFSVCKRALKENGKFINISIIRLEYKKDLLIGGSEEIKIPPINIQNPIPEPKFIISRYIDEKTVYLPNISLDMIRWSLKEGSRIVIFTPNSRISIYLKNFLLKTDEFKGLVGISSERNREDYYSFVNCKKSILISSNYLDALEPVYNINVIVMYSDSEKYSEDALVYMCSMANNHTMESFRETWFISNDESENMLKAKSIIRSINKSAWESGYIRE